MARRLRALLASVALALAGLTLTAPPAGADPIDYVHLGDSYASGVGAEEYTGGSCTRSVNSYAVLWAQARDTRFRNDSCAGATVPTVLASQGSTLDAGTDRVTITIGGNDIGFSRIVAACRLGLGDCTRVNAGSRAVIDGELPGQLDGLFAWITARAPSATVVVTGYPVPFNATALCFGAVDRADRATVNETVRLLNERIATAVSAFGDPQVVYASVTERFAGHRLCDGGTRYLHDLVSGDVLGAAYHVTAAGHRDGYLPAVAAAG